VDTASRSAASSDVVLMERLGQGDETALTELLERYWKPLVKYALGFVGDLDSAEDIVQDASVRVWRSRANWRPIGSVPSYLYRIVRNLALQEQKRRKGRQRLGSLDFHTDAPATPAEELDRMRIRHALQGGLDTLSPRRRETVILTRFHNLSYNEVAEIMGISPQTVANQMSSALRDLRKVLRRQDF
jgi:RNA polymerase sigma-70 factor, ECF subfamily